MEVVGWRFEDERKRRAAERRAELPHIIKYIISTWTSFHPSHQGPELRAAAPNGGPLFRRAAGPIREQEPAGGWSVVVGNSEISAHGNRQAAGCDISGTIRQHPGPGSRDFTRSNDVARLHALDKPSPTYSRASIDSSNVSLSFNPLATPGASLMRV
ncbi:hypothetical protein KM043_001233 [Ampulex compressa]|nr:hypothetical protein KM043_001233 [Ampulex compressa]